MSLTWRGDYPIGDMRFMPEAIDVLGIRLLLNPAYEHTGELASLNCARAEFGEDMVVLYGDLVFI